MSSQNKRRKREDEDNRDFTCKCGKSYLSYAATYTHVKKKHPGDREALESIRKPMRGLLKRGRPAEKKNLEVDRETELLMIAEEAILKMHELLKELKYFRNMILDGNAENPPADELKVYNHLRDAKTSLLNLRIEDASSLFELLKALNKHFQLHTAARVRLTCEVIHSMWRGGNRKDGIQEQLKKLQLWDGQDRVNSVLVEGYEKWRKLQERGLDLN